MVNNRKNSNKPDNKQTYNKNSVKKNNKIKVSQENVAKDSTPQMFPKPDSAFKVLCSVRLCAAIWCHITDCDETFNYWEPLHYLMFNRGLQTWEYDPKFALRSYTYLLIHGVPGWIYKTMFTPNPMLIFYFIRCMLALICATSELYLYKAICREFGVHIGRMWIILQLFCPGMFIASSAFLPSSFSMYFINGALAAWWHQKFSLATFLVAISSLLGWPFSAVLGLPILFDIVFRQKKIRTFIFWSVISAATILIPMIVIDSSYFGKIVVAPLNLIFYNVFTSHGPNLYGIEPPSYYFFNGLLNFNIVWIMALITPIMILTAYIFVPAKSKPTLHLPYYLSLAPCYIWLVIFTVQPHKEERFLFPIYPLITLCGAISVDIIQKLFYRIKKAVKKLQVGQHYLDHSTFIAVIFVVLSTTPSVSRVLSLYRNYHAPLDLMMELSSLTDIQNNMNNERFQYNFCLAKDWYRFPNSFFFPTKQFRVRFLKSEFKGILPAYFSESENGTRIVHDYFNDSNEENEFMYFDYDECDFLFDLDTGRYTKLEQNYAGLTKEWEIVKTLPFLDSSESHSFFRAFYIPYISDYYVKMANFNLLKRIPKLKKKLNYT
uniref:Mannosyltransferase n=1 Tax=Culicoides sonorensis TaxID=179676 RepID=A0A336MEI6_CULSO